MATTEDESEFEELGSNGGEQNLKPEQIDPGETVTGSIQYLMMNVGQYDTSVVVLDVDGETRSFRITRSAGAAILDEDVSRGTRLKFERSDDEDNFTNDDGEEVTYYPLTVKGATGGDD